MAKEANPIAAALKMIKDKDVKYVDLRFTDPRGKMQHLTMDVSQMHEDAWQCHVDRGHNLGPCLDR